MLWLSTLRRAAVCLGAGWLLGIPAVVFGQTNYYGPYGTEYAIVGSLPGDQMWPDAAVTPSGGFAVWEDNTADGSGWGILARQLDSTLSGTLSTFRVNVQGSNDQENPRVATLKGGGAAFVWQGGVPGFQRIFARFLSSNNTWQSTNDVAITPITTNLVYTTNITTVITTNWNHSHTAILGYATNTITTIATNAFSNTQNFQINPAIAVLNNSNVVVVWASYNEVSPGSLLDVYGQILSPTGQTIGGRFLINQFISYNQRTPAVAALANGGFVVAWVSEQERVQAPSLGTNSPDLTANPVYYTATTAVTPSVDIYARLYNNGGVAQGNEFLVSTNLNPAANPSVAAATDGSFMVAWSGRDTVVLTNGWDVYARSFSSTGVGGTVLRVNTHLPGNQYAPRISAIGLDYLIVWTSLGQDGSREGVYGQFMHGSGLPVGGEFRVNTTTVSQQMQPTVASDGALQFLVVWTSYTAGPNSFDLFAQRYLNAAALLPPISDVYVYAPFTLSNGVYQPQLVVSWPALLGISVSNYEVYVDGQLPPTPPMGLTVSNGWIMTALNGLKTNSSHTFQVDYVTTDDRRSPLSPLVSGETWSGANYYGIPFEWMERYYGLNFAQWPAPNAPLVPGGPTLYQVFLSGGNPLDPNTWLVSTLDQTPQGLKLVWNTQPGMTYQVEVTTNLTSWNNYGLPRFAAGTTDSVNVGGIPMGFYRVVLLR